LITEIKSSLQDEVITEIKSSLQDEVKTEIKSSLQDEVRKELYEIEDQRQGSRSNRPQVKIIEELKLSIYLIIFHISISANWTRQFGMLPARYTM
jgi:hypothetical protein